MDADLNTYYVVNGTKYIHIKTFASIIKCSKQNVRNLIFKGNKYRTLSAVRDGSRLLIAAHELEGFPFTAPNVSDVVYHYKDGEKTPCVECTRDHECDAAKWAREHYYTDDNMERERRIYRENEECAIYD